MGQSWKSVEKWEERMFQKIQAAIQILSFLFMDVENGKSGTNMRNGRNRLKAKETGVLLK